MYGPIEHVFDPFFAMGGEEDALMETVSSSSLLN